MKQREFLEQLIDTIDSKKSLVLEFEAEIAEKNRQMKFEMAKGVPDNPTEKQAREFQENLIFCAIGDTNVNALRLFIAELEDIYNNAVTLEV